MKSFCHNSFRFSTIFWIILFLFAANRIRGQNQTLRVVFWNVENLFDTRDDPLTNDDEFLPESDRKWDNRKLYKKLNNIYKVMMDIGEWNPPAIIGLCEVENRFVLNQLIYETPLRKFDYGVVHYDSPDRRGIDVGLLYRKQVFTVDTSLPISANFPFAPNSKTRDILYVRGRLMTGDTLHLFVNHWPSRYGGFMETQPKRNFVAGVLKFHTDSLFRVSSSPYIIILGDFNDDPSDESMVKHLMASSDTTARSMNTIYNLMAIGNSDYFPGTLKYQEGWNTFDQVIVSGNLLWDSNLRIAGRKAFIFHPGYLLEQDEKYLGQKPFRTYRGFKYSGGFSDHLPVYVDLILTDN